VSFLCPISSENVWNLSLKSGRRLKRAHDGNAKLLIQLVAGGGSNSRPWGYESLVQHCSSFHSSQNLRKVRADCIQQGLFSSSLLFSGLMESGKSLAGRCYLFQTRLQERIAGCRRYTGKCCVNSLSPVVGRNEPYVCASGEGTHSISSQITPKAILNRSAASAC
jgi:hypothetical protein